jgi:hypothetical protein
MVEGCVHFGRGTCRNYRRHLRAVGAAVLGPPVYPPRPLPIAASDLQVPYSATEVTALEAYVRGLPTEHFRQNASTVLALGLGCGLASQESSRAIGPDVLVDDEGVLIEVVGGSARQVPVLDRWAPALVARAVEVGRRPLVLPERQRITRHQLSNLLERLPKGSSPRLNTIRLRSTWIAGRLSAGVDPRVVAEAAGIAISQVVKYYRYATVPDPSEANRLLRRAGGDG